MAKRMIARVRCSYKHMWLGSDAYLYCILDVIVTVYLLFINGVGATNYGGFYLPNDWPWDKFSFL